MTKNPKAHTIVASRNCPVCFCFPSWDERTAIAAVNDENRRTIVLMPPMILSSWWLAAWNISGYQLRYTP